MNILRTDRKGVALAAAILALVVIGALVTGGFYAASHESRVSMSSKFAGRAYYFAKQGIHRTLSQVDRQEMESLPPGDARFVDFDENGVGPNDLVPLLNLGAEHSDTVLVNDRPVGAFRVTIRRMDSDPNSTDDRLFWIQSEGEVLEGGRYSGATRTVGITVRTTVVSFPLGRAMQLNGDLDIKGNSTIDGRDNPPDNWENCPPTTPDGAAIVHTSDSDVKKKGNASDIYGDIVEDPEMDEGDFFDFGDLTFHDLLQSATSVYINKDPGGVGPVESGGSCVVGLDDNWGAPKDVDSPCHWHFPVIYDNGNMHLSGHSAGQGILLVEGNLKISGGFEFYGVVIVKGAIESTGTGGHINGVVVAGGGGLLDTYEDVDNDGKVSGNSIINYSSCAVKRAQQSLPQTRNAAPLARRAWVDLSAAGA